MEVSGDKSCHETQQREEIGDDIVEKASQVERLLKCIPITKTFHFNTRLLKDRQRMLDLILSDANDI